MKTIASQPQTPGKHQPQERRERHRLRDSGTAAGSGALIAVLFLSTLAGSAEAGDWGKAPVPKEVIEECVDLGGSIDIGYHTDYLFKGLLVGGDTATMDVVYQIDGLALPVSVGVGYANIISPNEFSNVYSDELAVSGKVDLPAVAGIEAALSYTHRFYPEDPNTAVWPSSHGEAGLHLLKKFQNFAVSFNLYHNFNLPNGWNGTIPTLGNQESGAWYWDLGLQREFPINDSASLVLAGGVAYADNYWGTSPNNQTGGRSSGWNHYYLRAALPVDLNCRTTITPYVGYMGAPEGWLIDGAPDFAFRPAQSDLLHGGLNLKVSF